MVAAVKELSDARVLLHSCGSVAPMIPDMIDTGIDALNPVQVSADNMDPAKLKADFGDRLAFWGGIDTQDVLPFRTPAEVGEYVHFIYIYINFAYHLWVSGCANVFYIKSAIF